jgi:hypothetical protein
VIRGDGQRLRRDDVVPGALVGQARAWGAGRHVNDLAFSGGAKRRPSATAGWDRGVCTSKFDEEVGEHRAAFAPLFARRAAPASASATAPGLAPATGRVA